LDGGGGSERGEDEGGRQQEGGTDFHAGISACCFFLMSHRPAPSAGTGGHLLLRTAAGKVTPGAREIFGHRQARGMAGAFVPRLAAIVAKSGSEEAYFHPLEIAGR
jgi:hypothetical protein